jgi:nitroreductase
MDSSEFYEFLVSRSSVREYTPRKVTGDERSYILDCASAAPSAGNLEAWDVVIVEADELRESLSLAAYDQPHVRDAPLLMVVCANYVRSMSRYGERGILYALEDATIACTYMMLAAHALRLQSCWVGAFDEDEVRAMLSLPPHVRPVSILCIGRGSSPASQTERMPVAGHVHQESW